MMKYFFCLLILLSSCNTMNKSKAGDAAESVSRYRGDYTYADGSGNVYEFNKNRFEYFPVKPEQSSTGRYSGGDYIKLKPQPGDIEKVVDLIRAALADTADHVQSRDKGTGQISIKNKSGVQSFILYMQSPHKKLIEEALIKIKNK
jgi:hypothetical protein